MAGDVSPVAMFTQLPPHYYTIITQLTPNHHTITTELTLNYHLIITQLPHTAIHLLYKGEI